MPEARPGSGYSPEAYEALVGRFREHGYSFRPYTEASGEEPVVFLRHDIDYSLSWAVDLARRNERLGVRGTFFLQLRSPLYNLAAFETLQEVRELVAAGQWIAFHVTLPERELDREERHALIRADFERAREMVPEMQPVFAWHNPSLKMGELELDEHVSGFVNVYGGFADRPVRYVSDSNMRYSLEELEKLAGEGVPALQLALAPMQWIPDRGEMIPVLARNLGRKVRDLEVEFIRNHVYRVHFPDGLPEQVLRDFEAAIERASRNE